MQEKIKNFAPHSTSNLVASLYALENASRATRSLRSSAMVIAVAILLLTAGFDRLLPPNLGASHSFGSLIGPLWILEFFILILLGINSSADTFLNKQHHFTIVSNRVDQQVFAFAQLELTVEIAKLLHPEQAVAIETKKNEVLSIDSQRGGARWLGPRRSEFITMGEALRSTAGKGDANEFWVAAALFTRVVWYQLIPAAIAIYALVCGWSGAEQFFGIYA